MFEFESVLYCTTVFLELSFCCGTASGKQGRVGLVMIRASSSCVRSRNLMEEEEDGHNFISQKFIAIGCCTVVTTRCICITHVQYFVLIVIGREDTTR